MKVTNGRTVLGLAADRTCKGHPVIYVQSPACSVESSYPWLGLNRNTYSRFVQATNILSVASQKHPAIAAILTKGELSLNLRCLIILSKLHLLPLSVNKKNGKIQVLQGQNVVSWYALVAVAQLNIIYATGTFLFELRNGYQTAFESFSFDFLFTFPCEYTLLAGMWAFIKWPHETALVFNSCLSSSGHDEDMKGSRRSVKEFSLLELLTILVPACVFPAAVILLAAKVYAATWPHTATLPTHFRLLVLVMEAFSFFTCISCIYWVVLNQTLFMGKISFELENQFQIIKEASHGIALNTDTDE